MSDFLPKSRNSRVSAEVYSGTPNKETRRMTKSLRKSVVSGRERAGAATADEVAS